MDSIIAAVQTFFSNFSIDQGIALFVCLLAFSVAKGFLKGWISTVLTIVGAFALLYVFYPEGYAFVIRYVIQGLRWLTARLS